MIVKMASKLTEKRNSQVMLMLVMRVDLIFLLMGNFLLLEMQMVNYGFGIGEQTKITE